MAAEPRKVLKGFPFKILLRPFNSRSSKAPFSSKLQAFKEL